MRAGGPSPSDPHPISTYTNNPGVGSLGVSADRLIVLRPEAVPAHPLGQQLRVTAPAVRQVLEVYVPHDGVLLDELADAPRPRKSILPGHLAPARSGSVDRFHGQRASPGVFVNGRHGGSGTESKGDVGGAIIRG